MLFTVATGVLFAQLPPQVPGGGDAIEAEEGRPRAGSRPASVPDGITEEGEAAAYADIGNVDFKIGIYGYPSRRGGVVVTRTVRLKDFNRRGRLRSPAGEIQVDFRGNGRLVPVRLEHGDKILEIEGMQIASLTDLAVALNSAADPHNAKIVFVDWRTGNRYTGILDAARVNR